MEHSNKDLARDCHTGKCLNCNTETSNPKFCSRSCSASVTGRTHPKRKRKKTCKICSVLIYSNRTYCQSCFQTTFKKLDSCTIQEVRGARAYQKSSRIRDHARRVFLSSNPNPICLNCKYSKHIEVCHIKAISQFEAHEKVSNINSLSNLVGLCRNCHWELDSGLLHLPI
jgi:hypothetical protein